MNTERDTPTCSERPLKLARAYQAVTACLAAGLIRMADAKIVHLTTRIILLRFHTASPPIMTDSIDPRLKDIVESMKIVRFDHFDGHEYVTSCSLLVYATALLDSFFSGTTAFLLTLHPTVLGAASSLSVKDLLSATSKYAAVNRAVRHRVRSVSFETFFERLKFLNKTFGLGITLDSKERSELERFSMLRNNIVHDQDSLIVELDDSGEIAVRQDKCFRHPTPVSYEDLEAALELYQALAGKIYAAVMTKVIKVQPEHDFGSLPDVLFKPQSKQLNLRLTDAETQSPLTGVLEDTTRCPAEAPKQE